MKDVNDISKLLSNFVNSSPLNIVPELDNMVIYEEPLVAIASAQDPLFAELKKPDVISPEHFMPEDWLPGAKSIISYFLPFSERVRVSNRATIDLPSTEWIYGRFEGEKFNNAVRTFLISELEKLGAHAIAPQIDPRFAVKGCASRWSERHIAYIAGLGTFNLSKSMITEKGCAGRFGSVVTDLELPPTARPYTGLYDYCNDCGACIPRCPVDAITLEGGKSHPPCKVFNDEMLEKFKPRYGCGKCQTGVPCEHGIPKQKNK